MATVTAVPSDAVAKTSKSEIKNIVLVHGAWADGSSWSKVVPLLQARGYNVVCTQNALSGLADDVVIAKRIIDAQDGPVLLAGHSYGGCIITEAGNHPKVAGLVYVAAFAPDSGGSLGGDSQPYPTPALGEVKPIADGYLLLSQKGILEDFAQDLAAAEKMTMFATQGPTHSSIFETKISHAAWRDKPSWYVVGANDRTISPVYEAMVAKRMGATTITVPSSHVAMLAKPNEVAELILSAADALSRGVAKQPEAALAAV